MVAKAWEVVGREVVPGSGRVSGAGTRHGNGAETREV